MTGYHTRWARPEEAVDDPERIAIREALAFGKALCDIRAELGLTITELAARAGMTDDDIERIEERGTEPTVPLLRRLAAALNATVHLTPDTTWARSPSRSSPPEHTRIEATHRPVTGRRPPIRSNTRALGAPMSVRPGQGTCGSLPDAPKSVSIP
jgi:transcriptional regulator with XRE-family HTH domain